MTTTPAEARVTSAVEPTRRAKYAFLGTLYSTQYLAVSFFFVAFPAIMRSEGVSLERLGAFQLIGLIWVVKSPGRRWWTGEPWAHWATTAGGCWCARPG